MNPPRTERAPDFPSRFVKARNADVWLPGGYPQPSMRYAVAYMQDGQNLFDPNNARGGAAWEVDRTRAALSSAVRPCIVAGIWNSYRPSATTRRRGFRAAFPGAAHNEAAWEKQLGPARQFLLGR